MTENPETEKICVLALDIDGVLVHPNERFAGGPWDSRIQEDLGIDPVALGQKFFRVHWPEIIIGKRDLRETLDLVLPDLNPEITTAEFMNYWFRHDAHIDEGVVAELRTWKQRTNGLLIAVTNQEKYRVAYLIDELGLGEFFDQLIWSGDIGITKSSPDFYEKAIAKVGCDPHCVWFFDDDERNVAVASEAGWHAHHFVGLEDMRQSLLSICA
ncbi:HAD-IA family hydrolase [Streptomyces sp. NPDC096934]|uniref:HAD family hydrolase n=1 Tax=Streptomyces sp. NPDC096934 TaxID=3155551 RepID=UPI003333B55F